MISIFETEDLDYVVFEKDEKPEKPKIKRRLDELGFEQLICKEKESQPDENQLRRCLPIIRMNG